jgi:GT2 family glycosyltransferase
MTKIFKKTSCVIVTYNRKHLLIQCLAAVWRQSYRPEKIFIIDNASTDGTIELLHRDGWADRPEIHLITLSENTGGAGGFSSGLDCAIKSGSEWVWMMDDDAEPKPTAFEELMKIAEDPSNIYGSLATNSNETSWLMTLLTNPPTVTGQVADIPASANVQMLPFLGFLVHANLVKTIGLPDSGFFIAADDVEYCLRAQKHGAKIIVAGKSHIEHPKSQTYNISFFGKKLTCLKLSPWKCYYNTRNKLLIARKYYGLRLFTQTIPGSFLRLFATLTKEPKKFAQLWAFFAGFTDGLVGLKGRRHEKWGIDL